MTRVGFLLTLPFLLAICLLGQNHETTSALEQYVQQASEFSSRARANVYFPNAQSIFNGVQVDFVNVGAGNLTFLRRDLVVSGHIPIVIARVYDSAGTGSTEFGPGWNLSAAETISVEGGKAHLFSESGSEIVFIQQAGAMFRLEKDRPSDYSALQLTSPTVLIATLRTGFTKEFSLIGKEFKLTRVRDRNGNELRLLYQGGLLSKIENEHHGVIFSRTKTGRVYLVQDDTGRQVGYKYDNYSRLVEADDRGGNAWKYSYFEEGRLHTATDPLQRLNFSVGFDEQGRVHSLQLPFGVIQYRYEPGTRSTTVTDRRQLTSRFFQNEEGITTRVVNALGEETAITLDAVHNVTALTRNGTVIESLRYDQRHQLLFRRSTGATAPVERNYSYDPATGHLLGIESSTGVAVKLAYDRFNNLEVKAKCRWLDWLSQSGQLGPN